VDNLGAVDLGESWSKARQKRKEKRNPIPFSPNVHKALKDVQTSSRLSSD
jgi:hypothetical protein